MFAEIIENSVLTLYDQEIWSQKMAVFLGKVANFKHTFCKDIFTFYNPGEMFEDVID